MSSCLVVSQLWSCLCPLSPPNSSPSLPSPTHVGDNGSMHFWDWQTGYNFQKLQTQVQPGSLDSEAGIFTCCFDISGCRLLTAEADKTIKIYKEEESAVRTAFWSHVNFLTHCYIFIVPSPPPPPLTLPTSLPLLTYKQTEETHPINFKPEILKRKRY